MHDVEGKRGLEVLLGIVMALPAVICVAGAGWMLVEVTMRLDIAIATLVLLLLGAWLGRLAFRLITGRGREHGGLFSPAAILAGGAMFAVGAAIGIALGLSTGEWYIAVVGVEG